MTRQARVPAYAKLNLGLRILYKRPDGFHELRTVFQTISVADSLTISFTRARTSAVTVEGTPHIQDNLIERASKAVLEALGISAKIALRLEKRIPEGAGLGGGSSDAAAVLLALPILAGKPIPSAHLQKIAATLGSDVPFFLHGGTALGLGRGEELYPLPDRPSIRGLLVAPAVHSSTAQAYRELSGQLTSNSLQNKLVSFQQEIWQGGGSVDGNDFESVVFSRHPELRGIRDRLLRLGAKPAFMTGSGSAIFGFFDDPSKLDKAVGSFAGERIFKFSLLTRAQYRSRWSAALRSHLKGNQWPLQSLYAR